MTFCSEISLKMGIPPLKLYDVLCSWTFFFKKFIFICLVALGLLVTSLVAQMVKRLSTMWETWVRTLGWEVPWRRKWQPTPVLLPRKSHGRRSLVSMGLQRVRHDWATSLSLTFSSFTWRVLMTFWSLWSNWRKYTFCFESTTDSKKDRFH